jgi:thiamine-monophosphate kinase
MKTDITEAGILSKIYRLSKNQKNAKMQVGPGDDCAVIKIDKRKALVVTTDGLVEGTHFITYKNNAKNLAKKLLLINLSDIAAMGGVKPTNAVCAAGLPAKISQSWTDSFMQSLFSEAKRFGLTVSGGNLSKSKTLHLYLTVFGMASPDKIIKRSGAKPGDLIYCLGNLGHSRAGFELIKKQSKKFNSLANNFLKPKICLKEAKMIVENKLATAMIDNSDGLFESVRQLAFASKCAAKIEPAKKLISPKLTKYCKTYNKNAKDYILYGGEDYGLVFTVKPKSEKKLLKILPESRKLGIILKGKGVTAGEKETDKTFVHF